MFASHRFAVLCLVPALALAAQGKSEKLPQFYGPQPAVESLDLSMYARIREEGLRHSHVMEFAGGLADDIGPRLTGSPNMAKANAWTRDQLTAVGLANAHLEDWGEFGMGWQQLNTWVRMTAPDTEPSLVAHGYTMVAPRPSRTRQARPSLRPRRCSSTSRKKLTSPSYKGKLSRARSSLLGEMRPRFPSSRKPLFTSLHSRRAGRKWPGLPRQASVRLQPRLARNSISGAACASSAGA